MAKAEVGGLDDDDDTELVLDENELKKADREGLTDFSNLDYFLLWYQLGGSERGLSPMEIAEMPAGMIKDFLFLLGRLSKKKKTLRKAKDRKKKLQGDDD